ncbi:MAG: precorrin-6A reductase [Candidatus Brocadiaceae bacterium]|nr:precorrin-6A reductase [Candidatus Brocadiaceae bacterium]
MILVMSGTADGRELVQELNRRGKKLLTTVATAYGASLYEDMGLGGLCVEGRLDKAGLIKFIEENGIDTIVDATHPYAKEASKNAIEACQVKGVRYIRLERNSTQLPQSPLLHIVKDMGEAIELSSSLGNRILVTTGYNSLPSFIRLRHKNDLVVRILPVPEHIQGCIKMGIPPWNIHALQGPFSKEFNRATIREFNIDVVVTKDGGKEAKTLEKIEACLEEGIPIVVIQRPSLDYPSVCSSIQEVLERV